MLAVVASAISHGRAQGLLVVMGVLIADYIFIFFALSGLTVVAGLMGEFAVIIKYLGITYLFWLAYVAWTSEVTSTDSKVRMKSSSLATGVLMTISNPKAILFYMGFFPAFVDLYKVTMVDFVSVFAISTVSVGGVLAIYACVAAKASFVFKSHTARKRLNKISGGFLVTCGAVLAAKS